MSKHSPGPLHLIPDAPITSPGFDRLDRMAFVRSFAEAIRAVKGTDSVVLALAGPWGSGKSSLLNLIAGELETTAGEQPPLVLKFNPWWFSGTQQLVAAFLQQLGAAVSRPEVKETLGEATVALDHLAESIAKPGLKTESDPASRDIEVIRHKVNSILGNSDRRILIFMDDIDRLTPEEMTQLLLIVRAVADFQNTTYVLSFDYEVVVDSIGNKLGVDGRTYLEKVVQLQIDVPMPGRMILERMVIGQLQAIDPTAKSLDKETQRHFRILFEGGIKHFLATPRACTRLLNVLRFTYPTLAGQVYFPDLLGISCLMSFSSQAIQAIRSFSDAFVGHCDPSGKGWLNIRKFHHSWLAEIPKRDRAPVESIVRLLFPKVAWALNGPICGEEYIQIWHRQKRICSIKHFDTYFRLGLTAGEAAEYQWQHMVELLDDATAFAGALQRFGPLEEEGEAGWVGELLQQAADFVNEKATADQARNLFRAIMRRGDQIAAVKDSASQHRMKIGPVHWVTSVLLDCLQRMDDPEQRLEVLRTSVAEDAGLLTSAELLELLEYRIDIFADGKHAPTAEANTAKLLEVLRILDKRIQQAGLNGELAEHPQFMSVVQKWWQFGRKAKSRTWVRATCESDERYVDALLQLWSGSGSDFVDDSAGITHELPIDLLVEFFEPGELLTRCESVLGAQPDWLTPNGALALGLLAELLHKRSSRKTIQHRASGGRTGAVNEPTDP
ncbi:MAG: AAA family ATPase [Planctomycetes bacterium]|nr:AAA family ATPase [Planctomycetota bacterium]